MYLAFDSMPGNSRLWIYQADRRFKPEEKKQLYDGLVDLCENWSAHGTPLHTSFSIELDQFIILIVDEQQSGASGCSIDGTVHYLKSLQEKLGLNFFDRTRIAFLAGLGVVTYPMTDLKSLFEKKTLTAETVSFDNTISSKAEWIQRWRIPVKASWLAKYLPQKAVVG